MDRQQDDSHPNIDPLDVPVWGARNIGRLINRSERQTYWLLERGAIDATKVRELWQSTPRRIRRSLGMEVA